MEKSGGKLVVVCKRECATCEMIVPVLKEMEAGGVSLTIYTQDDPGFPDGLSYVSHDDQFENSRRLGIETVPTLIRFEHGREAGRVQGWDRAEWRILSGLEHLGQNLPESRPGCGAKNVEPGIAESLAVRFGDIALSSRRIEPGEAEDEMEVCHARGWTDGLPVVPPTEVRVVRMLKGTSRDPGEVLAEIPPNNAACTVEKAAVNAVMAGCRPEYLPAVLAAVEAACTEEFCLHGLVATTYFSGPVIMVNGPVRRNLGMNSGINVFGQGCRANAAIGRALQLIIRNLGGGIPGGIDRAVFGTPGKYSFCFAENEEDSPWEPLSVERGFNREDSCVSLFAGGEVQGVTDQLSRDPESLSRSYAAGLRSVAHPKIAMAADAVLAVSPGHGRVFKDAGWTKADLKNELERLLTVPGKELVRGAGGIAEGIPGNFADSEVPKFRPGGLDIVFAGGPAGMFSAILGCWVASGPRGSSSVTREIRP